MNILMTNMNYRSRVVGGGQGSLQVLADGLAREGHQVTVVSLGETPHQDSANGVNEVRLPIRNRYWPFDGATHSATEKALWHAKDLHNAQMAGDLTSIIDDVRPDLIHTNVMAGWSVAIWGAAARRDLPIIHTLRDYYVVCLRSERFKNGHRCTATCAECLPYLAFRSRASDRVTAVVGNSDYILNEHLRLGAFAHTHIRRVIYNGFEPPSPLPPRVERTGRLRLGFLGRIAQQKGIEVLLTAVAALPAGTVELLIAGSGEAAYQSHLADTYASQHIRFLGFTQPADLFPRIDALVVPSVWPEPLPRTSFEAFGFGVPVIGSDQGGIPETIEQGVTGFVFSPDDVLSLSQLIAELSRDPSTLDRMRPAVLQRSKDFAPARVVSDYIGVYDEALKAKSTSAKRP